MTLSSELFNEAQKYIPGGVNSPVRAFKGVGGDPIFFEKGEGAFLKDTEGKHYIDYVQSWGPLILGHAHPKVINAVNEATSNGLSYGAPTEVEIHLAKKVCEIVPSIEMVRMVSSGTEATMAAIRLARGYTGRDKILKFAGCYHGCSDSLLSKAGSGVLTLGIPSSPDIPPAVAELTLTAEFNNTQEVEEIFEKYGNDLSAVIIEPIAGNMNFIPAIKTFLAKLRELCDNNNSVLIFDEVMSGFRVGLGGAQEQYRITPDLTTLGKVIGGGMPVGAFGGKKEIMKQLAPLGPIYQAGTLSGNPIAMIAGLTTLNEISKRGFFEDISKKTQRLCEGIRECAKKHSIPFTTQYMGSMFGFFFTDKEVLNSFSDVETCDIERFKQFFHGMLEEGVYLAPSTFEAGFMSLTHTNEIIDQTIEATDKVFKRIST